MGSTSKSKRTPRCGGYRSLVPESNTTLPRRVILTSPPLDVSARTSKTLFRACIIESVAIIFPRLKLYSTTSPQPGLQISATNAANDFTGVMNATGATISLVDVNTIVLGEVTATGALYVKALTGNITRDNLIDSISASTGFIGTAGVASNPLTALTFTTLTTLNVGAATTADVTGPGAAAPSGGIFSLTPVPITTFYNGINVTPQAAGAAGAVQAAVAGAIASAGDAAEAAFGTDSVGEQIANG